LGNELENEEFIQEVIKKLGFPNVFKGMVYYLDRERAQGHVIGTRITKRDRPFTSGTHKDRLAPTINSWAIGPDTFGVTMAHSGSKTLFFTQREQVHNTGSFCEQQGWTLHNKDEVKHKHTCKHSTGRATLGQKK